MITNPHARTVDDIVLTDADAAAHEVLSSVSALGFATAAELTALSGLQQQAVHRVLKRLARLGLVAEYGGEWLPTDQPFTAVTDIDDEAWSEAPRIPIDGLAVLRLLERSGPTTLGEVASQLRITLNAALSWTTYLSDLDMACLREHDRHWRAVA